MPRPSREPKRARGGAGRGRGLGGRWWRGMSWGADGGRAPPPDPRAIHPRKKCLVFGRAFRLSVVKAASEGKEVILGFGACKSRLQLALDAGQRADNYP